MKQLIKSISPNSIINKYRVFRDMKRKTKKYFLGMMCFVQYAIPPIANLVRLDYVKMQDVIIAFH